MADTEEPGTFKMHLDAQFECDHLVLKKRLYKKAESSALDEVREIVPYSTAIIATRFTFSLFIRRSDLL